MTRISWAPPVNPRYELGVDRGVIKMEPAGISKAWNGLISVDENVQGADRTEHSFDGIKYMDLVSATNWQATIRAFSYPTGVSSALGFSTILSGFYLARQPRSEFWFSYRTMMGDGSYRLHIVYNATLIPNQPGRKTITDTPDPDIFEWTIFAVPDTTQTNIAPTAHFVINSWETDPAKVSAIEDIIYGTDSVDSRFPTVSELVTIVNS